MTRFKFYYSFFIAAVLLAICVDSAHCQTPVVLAPPPELQFFDQNGVPLAFGCVFTYQTLSTTPLATFTDATGTVQNANPVVLDASGFPSNGSAIVGIWMQAGLAYTFRVKGAGGTNCTSGSTLYTVDGIGGGISTLTTIVTYASTVTFVDASQNQLFELTLTGNATSQPLTAVGITPPGIVTWEITQDGSGGHTFSWPANTIGGATICSVANCVTQQTFIWNGTEAIALGPATYSSGPAYAVTSLYDFALSASATVCTDANKQLTSSCSSVLGITINGQVIPPGGSGNVNNGAATHSMAINEGNGAAIAGVLLSADQVAVGKTSADPTGSSLPACPDTAGQHLNYAAGGTFSCGTSSAGSGVAQLNTITLLGADVPITASTPTVFLTKAVTMPSAGCPCRALVSYGAYFDSGSSGTATTWIDDSTNEFATSQILNNDAGGVGPGAAASSMSPVTYANGASVTFHANVNMTNSGGGTVKELANAGTQHSWMAISVFTAQ